MHSVYEDLFVHFEQQVTSFFLQFSNIGESAPSQISLELWKKTKITGGEVGTVRGMVKYFHSPFLHEKLSVISRVRGRVVVVDEEPPPFPKLWSFAPDGILEFQHCSAVLLSSDGGSWLEEIDQDDTFCITKKSQHCLSPEAVRAQSLGPGVTLLCPSTVGHFGVQC